MPATSSKGRTSRRRSTSASRPGAKRSSSKGSTRPARSSRSRAGSRPTRRSSARGRTRGPRSAQLDPIAMLMEDHRRVEKLFEQFESAKNASRKQALFGSIRAELELHTRLEEEIFYPAIEGRQELAAEVKEAHGEHDEVKQMLREAGGFDPGSGEFDATVAGIQGAVEHHVQEEEEQMFPEVRHSFAKERLQELGQQMNELKATARRGNAATGSRSLAGGPMGR